MGLEQRLAERLAAKQRRALVETPLRFLDRFTVGNGEYLARQRKAVGVQSRAWDAEQHIARGDARAIDDAVAFDHADDEAREVEVARRIDIRHVRRFAAEERAILRRAGTGDAFHEGLLLLGAQS